MGEIHPILYLLYNNIYIQSISSVILKIRGFLKKMLTKLEIFIIIEKHDFGLMIEKEVF